MLVDLTNNNPITHEMVVPVREASHSRITLSPGASITGCVVYELPEAVKAAKVQFGLNGNVEDKWSIEGL